MKILHIEDTIGNTPLVALRRMNKTGNLVLLKLEGDNPAGSVKDRPALSMIVNAEKQGRLKPGDSIIEATSGNTGIALSMIAAIKGYTIKIVMPESASGERKKVMRAYGAELVLSDGSRGMEGAIDIARTMEKEGKGIILDQFANSDNPKSHYETTGPEVWEQTDQGITHFVSAMGTTGTITGCSRFLKEKNPEIQVIGVQPADGAKIPGIRKWPDEYLPAIYEAERIDRLVSVNQKKAEETARRLAAEEGIFCGVSSGGNVYAALELAHEVNNAVIVTIICDRGDRYISTSLFD